MSLQGRLLQLEDRLNGGGLLVKAWAHLPDGRAVTNYAGQAIEQQLGEELCAFLRRVARSINRRVVVWVSPQDAAL